MSEQVDHPTEVTDDLPYWPIMRAPGDNFDPPEELRRLAAEKPLRKVRIWDGSTPWLITGHAAQRALMADPRVSVNTSLPGFPHWHEGHRLTGSGRFVKNLVNQDPPEHTRLRRMLTPSFTAKRMQALRTEIERITNDLIDAMLAGPKPVDLVEAFALPLPSYMICALLGTPYEDHEFVQTHTAIGINRFATAEITLSSSVPMSEYMRRQLERKLDDPAQDALSDLAARVKSGELSLVEGTAAGQALLSAGFETSANMIALGTLALLQHPDQRAFLEKTDDPAVIANVVEELLRYLSIIHNGQRRVALDDIEVAGETIRAGEGIVLELVSANRDASVFPDADRLDVQRTGASQHHGFGYGTHQCLGQQLARVELQVAYKALFDRVPTLELATTIEEVTFKDDKLAYGVYDLPITW